MNLNLWKLDDHPELVSALFAAHREAAIANDNASKLCVQQAYGGSGRFENAIIAGMATIGALHAPLAAARELIDEYFWVNSENSTEIYPLPYYMERIPGFGNSFHADGDPAFKPVAHILEAKYPIECRKLALIAYRANLGRAVILDPNAAMYTAIVASICEVPRGLECTLFALARIPAWAEMCGAMQHPKVGGVR